MDEMPEVDDTPEGTPGGMPGGTDDMMETLKDGQGGAAASAAANQFMI